MLNIPYDILTSFVAVLTKRSIPFAHHNYYKKWLRYYLDFCAKYNLPDDSSKSLPQFLGKMREKKQTEEQIKQAGMQSRCILIFGVLQQKLPRPPKERLSSLLRRKKPFPNFPLRFRRVVRHWQQHRQRR
jgi:hypothetical protein